MLEVALNTARVAMKPSGLREISRKSMYRLRRVVGAEDQKSEVEAWCAPRAVSQSEWASAQDADLWREATEFAREFQARARQTLAQSKVRFGGGGAYALLYFLVRQRQPEYVVETGVAAGWSSAAVLAAMERNGKGHLWSSDFPYFRQSGASEGIGVVVPAELRHRWTLYIEGDATNLPRIMAELPRIDLFHFDSDKTYAGRRRALAMVQPKLSSDAPIILDDVQDNWHFRDLAGPNPLMFEEGGKYVGALRL